MGSIAIASPNRSLQNLLPNNQGYSIGSPLTPWKYSGATFDFAADASGTGNAVVPTLGTVPTDAVAIEMWVNGNASDDYIFATTVAGQLGATGVFATNITANLAAVRWAASGGKIIIPCTAIGTAPTLRVATGKASARIQGRFISQASGFPYLLASLTNSLLIGAGGSQQFAFTDAARFPAGYNAVLLQVLGAGPMRVYFDGTAVTSTTGDLVPPGTYLIDLALHGVSLSALRMHLPTGTNVFAHSLKAAV
jgi:hypothetical protein